MPEELLVGLCIIPLVAIPFIFFGFVRYLRHRETMALAEKGLISPSSLGSKRDTLRWGIIFTALGLALMCGLYPLGWGNMGRSFLIGFGPWMLLGLLPTAFGLALIIIYRLTKDENGNGTPVAGGPGPAGGGKASPETTASPVPPGWGETPQPVPAGWGETPEPSSPEAWPGEVSPEVGSESAPEPPRE